MTYGLQQYETNIKHKYNNVRRFLQKKTNMKNKYNNDIRFVAKGD